jgi:hypothetical protein
MNKAMANTERGRLYKKLDRFREKWRRRAYSVEVPFRDFVKYYERQDKCVLCGDLLGIDRDNIALFIKDLPRSKVITMRHITMAHVDCVNDYYANNGE